MTETPGTGPAWHGGEPLVSRTAEPDWGALAERHEHEVKRRKQIRVAAAGVAGVVAIAGIMATVIQLSGGHRSTTAAASAKASATGSPSAATGGALDGSTSVTLDGGGSPAASASAPGGSAAPAAQSPAGQAPTASSPGGAAPAPAGPGGGSTTPAGAPAPQQTTSAPAPVGPPPPQKPPAPTPTATNPYTPVEACGGGGYFVIDSHALSGATVYLLYNNGTGNNCVVTMATHPAGSVSMNATLAVQGGGSGSNPGNFTDYAGPVVEHAPAACVEWGGSYQGSSWTSGWSHCSR